MQSFIIISKNREKAREIVKKMADEQNIAKFDIFFFESEKQTGIADIRSLSRQISLKPLSGDKKIVVLEAFYGITIDAQNAFLKVLEEPPLSTTIVILANSNFFLPTILSRCKLIELDREISLDQKERQNLLKILEDLRSYTIGERLKLAQDLAKDREEALSFIEKLIVVGRFEMVKKQRLEYKTILQTLQRYHKEIKQSNVNLRLGLENLFLDI